MKTKIAETTAIGGFGSPSGNKQFKVSSGTYAGRMISIFKTSDNDIKFCYANRPYNNWSSMITIVSDSSSAPIDAVMLSNGDVILTYCELTTSYLCSVRLTIDASGWSVGSKVYIYDGNNTSTPSVTKDVNDTLYVCFSRYNGSTFDIQVKSSSDSGASWGGGSTDIGETITSGLTVGIPKVMTSDDRLFVVYVTNWSDIKVRNRLLSSSNWSTEYTVSSGANIDAHFDAIVLPEGFLGVVYDNNGVYYREFDGVNWGPVTTIDISEGFFPQLTIVNNVPVILYLSEYGTGQYQLKQCNRITGNFSSPEVMELPAKQFDTVFLYNSNSSSYENKTSEASSNTSADVYHSASNALCVNLGDKLYVGLDTVFRYIKFILSTAGNGGIVTYSYFDGSNWNAFTPAGGSYNLDSTEKELLLWTDIDSVPSDWQKQTVNGINRYWIKIEVTAGFTILPVGSQLTSISNLEAISVRR